MSKVLLVTGGSRGIGAATARLAAVAGWDVAINYTRDAAAAQALAADVRAAGRRALVIQADVGVEAEVLALFGTLDAQWGPGLAGLVNNAGVVDLASRVDAMGACPQGRSAGCELVQKSGRAGKRQCTVQPGRQVRERPGCPKGRRVSLFLVVAFERARKRNRHTQPRHR